MKKTYIDPDDVQGVEPAMLRRILGYMRPYVGASAVVVALIFGIALVELIPPLLVKQVVDVAIPNADLRLLAALAVAMILAPLAADGLGMAKSLLTNWLGERVMLDLRTELYSHLNGESLAFFSAIRPGEAVSRVLNDVEGVGGVVQSTVFGIVDDAIVFTTTALALLALDWRLALLGFVLLPLFILPTRPIGRKRKALKRQAQARKAEMTGILTETLSVSGTLLLKVFGAEKSELSRFRAKADELVSLSMRQTFVGQQYKMLVGLFKSLAPALVFGVGGLMAIQGKVEVGTLVAFVALLKRLYGPASSLAGVRIDVVVSYAYFERIFAVLDHRPSIASLPGAPRLNGVHGEIRYDDVSFRYGEDDQTLQHIELVVQPGQTVAVVGPSGAGKSTLAALVPRLYDPTEGSVRIDGKDLRSLDLASVRRCVGVVAQETYLFHASVLENLRYGRPGATLGQVEAAARAAQIHESIAALPEGYETMCGDRGHRFSGGERQRLAIARALLKDPPILVFDEATNSLDPQSEILVQQALDLLMRGRTCLVIAHRLSTVRDADLILVLEGGRIVERGTHDELLALGGTYARLYAASVKGAPL